MPPTNLPAELKRLQHALDAQRPPRTGPLVVPSWAGPSDTGEAEVRVTLRDGRVLIRVSDRFAEIARKAAFRP
jgi:hypothetical protein